MSDPPKYTSECCHCQEIFAEHSTELLLFKMQEHTRKNHNTSDEPAKKAEKVSAVERDCLPKIDKASGEMTMEEWLGFERNWKNWKKNLNRDINDYNQLLHCCFPKIRQRLAMLELQEGEDTSWSKEELARNIKELMVASTIENLQCFTFFQMRQQYNEPIRDFHIWLASTAETCNFTTECKAKSVCGSEFVSFKDEMMRSGLILGLYDSYIQQQAIARCSEQKSNRLSSKDLLEFVA